MKSRFIHVLLAVAVLSVFAISMAMGKTSNGISYSTQEIFTAHAQEPVHYELLGREEKRIRELNDDTVVAAINQTQITRKNFYLHKLFSDLNSAQAGEDFLDNDAVFDKIVRNTVILQDCDRYGITATKEEAFALYDDTYNNLKQLATMPMPEPTIEYDDPNGLKVTVESTQTSNPAQQALEEFEERLDGLDMSHEEYRDQIGAQTYQKFLLLSRHIQRICDSNNWQGEDKQERYEQYVQDLIDAAQVTITSDFPSESS